MTKRVLLVDDEASLRLSLGFWLRRNGFQVTACQSAGEARAVLDRERFDCVISDLRLTRGGAEGVLLVHRARELNPAARCILVTASPLEDVVTLSSLLDDAAITLCPKPVDVVELVRLLRKPARRPIGATARS